MELYDIIKASILSTPYVREPVPDNTAVAQYYCDMTSALHIEGLPLISVDTIEKRTYIAECNNNFFLIFDFYLLDIINTINHIVLANNHTKYSEILFFRLASEECFIQGKFEAAVEFGAKYMNRIGEIQSCFKKEDRLEETNDYLFVQQAFFISHEIFHFSANHHPKLLIKGMMSKERFLQRIYVYTKSRDKVAAAAMADVINNKNMVEECLCDTTAVIQAIDVGIKTDRMNVVEAGIAIAIALMSQYTISTIQDVVKFSGEILYERIQNLFNFRLLHLKAITSLYVKKIASEEKQEEYQAQVEKIHDRWFERINRPIFDLIVNYNRLFTENLKSSESGPEHIQRMKDILRQIYNSAI